MARSWKEFEYDEPVAVEEQDAVAVEIEGNEQSLIQEVIGSDFEELLLVDEPATVQETEPEPQPASREFDRGAFDRLLEIYKAQDREFSRLCALACRGTAFAERFLMAFSGVVGERANCLNQTATRMLRQGVDKSWLPNRMDFTADTELVAKRALQEFPALWKAFRENILDRQLGVEEWEEQTPSEQRMSVELVVGHAYLKAGMYPLSRYFSGTMVKQ